MRRLVCVGLPVLALGVTLAITASASAIEIGAAGPAWKGLAGVDGKTHSLGELKSAKAIVVCFTCNHCPVAVAYEDRLIKFVKDYKGKDVALVAINVNNMDADKLPAMKVRAKEKGFKFAYLYDPSQKIGRAFGAKVTPHVFVLDGKRRIAYQGSFDDNMNVKKAQHHYVRDAVDAILAGKSPAKTTNKPFGCGIKYE
jgi:thiol-disulfide isomerase/thioredoxin